MSNGDGVYLSFATNTPFKMNGFHEGKYRVFDQGVNMENGSPLIDEEFLFSPYWRHTEVVVDLSDYANDDGTFGGMLAVFDQWGDRTTKVIKCVCDLDDCSTPLDDDTDSSSAPPPGTSREQR